MTAWIKMALGMELGLSAGDFVLDVDHEPIPKRGWYCGQTVGWIKMKLGVRVGSALCTLC